MDAGAFHWQFSLGRCSCSGFHDDLPKHSAALRSHSQMNISHSLFLPWEDEHEMSTPSSFTLFVYVTSNKMPNLNQQRCTHCRRWPSCWPHRSCSRKIRCRGCPRWASTWDAAWRRCNTGHALGSTLTVITQTFETSCTVAWWGITAPKYWPVQIVHGCARASVSAVAAVVGIVQGGPAIGHHTQDHFPELVEGPVVQRLTWKQEKQQELETLFKGHFRNVEVSSPMERLAATRNTIWRVFILVHVKRQSPPQHLYISSVGLWYCSVSCSHYTSAHTLQSTHPLSVNQPEPGILVV